MILWGRLSFWFLVVLGVLVSLGGIQSCSTSSLSERSGADAGMPPESIEQVVALAHPRGCHPLARKLGAGACLLPFPSSYYLKRDPQTATGYRVALPNRLPTTTYTDAPTKADPTFYNSRDGFSPSTPILAMFSERVDPSTLIPLSKTARSLEKDSPVQVIEFGTRKRFPLLVEVDRTVDPKDPQVVIIRPLVRLRPNQSYAVVFLKSVKTLAGKTPSVSFRTDLGRPKTPEDAALAPLLKATMAELKAAEISSKQVLMAWSFHTASDEPLFREMLHMRKLTLEAGGGKGAEYTLTEVQRFTEAQNQQILRILKGTMKVPSFLSQDAFGGGLLRDSKGLPKVRGLGEFRFQVQIPRCAASRKEPIPLMVVGHGLFGSAASELNSGHLQKLANRLCMVQIAHNWRGLSVKERGSVAVTVPTDIDNVPKLIHLLQQSHMNALAMVRMALRRFPQEKEFQVDGVPVLNGKEVYYFGASNGAIQGGIFMALTPDVARAVLNVGGGNWSMLMSRSADFGPLASFMKTYYSDPVERQLGLALIQSHFDIVDPITYAPSLLSKPERFGVPAKRLLLQEGIGDAQIPNFATRAWVRTLGCVGLAPMFERVFQVSVKPGPLKECGYTQYGPRPDPPQEDANVPYKRNSQHGAVRGREAAIQQVASFFRPDGVVQQHCKGVCDPE